MMRDSSIVGAGLIGSHTSIKNTSGGRDSKMRQMKKGSRWHFGIKTHVGINDEPWRMLLKLERRFLLVGKSGALLRRLVYHSCCT